MGMEDKILKIICSKEKAIDQKELVTEYLNKPFSFKEKLFMDDYESHHSRSAPGIPWLSGHSPSSRRAGGLEVV